MKLPDQVRETIRQVIGLAPDHPIPDDCPIYSLGATPADEVRICWQLAVRIGLDITELAGEVLVGSNLQFHTVPFLVHSITEVLTNDSTTIASSQQAATTDDNSDGDGSATGRITPSEDAPNSGSIQQS